jgi:hypothetical protein
MKSSTMRKSILHVFSLSKNVTFGLRRIALIISTSPPPFPRRP